VFIKFKKIITSKPANVAGGGNGGNSGEDARSLYEE